MLLTPYRMIAWTEGRTAASPKLTEIAARIHRNFRLKCLGGIYEVCFDWEMYVNKIEVG